MADPVTAQESLEAVLRDEIIGCIRTSRKTLRPSTTSSTAVKAQSCSAATRPGSTARRAGAVASFAGVGNPHLRSHVQPGDTVVDLGSGAGLDAIIASWSAGPAGQVIGIDLNPAMCLKAQSHAATTGARMECREGRMEGVKAVLFTALRPAAA